MSSSSTTVTVTLNVYDLSNGMVRTFSPTFLGKQLDGLWHTSISVFSVEFYFGGGICSSTPPGSSPYGSPHSTQTMGTTTKSKEDFYEFLASISNRFTMSTYHLLENNCNNFSDECCRFLTGLSIPKYILDLPAEAMDSPMGSMIRPLIEQMQSAIQSQSIGHELDLELNHQTPSAPSRSLSLSDSYATPPISLSTSNRTPILQKLYQYSPSHPQNSSPSSLLPLSLSLPPAKAFPSLDLLRLEILTSSTLSQTFALQFPKFFTHFILPSPPPSTPSLIMTLRATVNALTHENSAITLSASPTLEILVESIVTSLQLDPPKVRKTAACLLFNLATAPIRYKQIPKLDEQHVVRLLFSAVETLNLPNAAQADFSNPLLASLIVLIDRNQDAIVMVRTFGLDLDPFRNTHSRPDDPTRKAVNDLATILDN